MHALKTGASNLEWIVFAYQPTALFSLKTSRATSTVGKTLLIPTPYAVKMAVRPKYSCGTTVVFEQAAKALSAYDRSPKPAVDRSVGRKQQDVALALVIPLRMKMLHELTQRTSQ